jgi:predicted transcriptional regulator of viral defense system
MPRHPSPTERQRDLYQLADRQGGYFTAKQAEAFGYTSNKRVYHVRAGNWVREYRGIYRLALFPGPERSDLILWWLWSRDRSDEPNGVFSHRTALSLHELTDLMPARIDLTVPKGFRRGAPIPKVLRLHYAAVPSSDREVMDGVPVTKALRTVLDLWGEGDTPKPLLAAAFQEGVRRGIITRSEVRRAAADPDWKQTIRALEKGRGR